MPRGVALILQCKLREHSMKTVMKLTTAVFLLGFPALLNTVVAQDNNQPQSQSYVKIKTMKIVNGDTVVTEKEYKGNGDMHIENSLGGNGFSNFSFHSFNNNGNSTFYNNFSQMENMFRNFNFGGNQPFSNDFGWRGSQMPYNNFDMDSIIKGFNFRGNDSLYTLPDNHDLIIKDFNDNDNKLYSDSPDKTNPDLDMQTFGRNNKGQQLTYNKKITILDKGIGTDNQNKDELAIDVFPNPGDGFFNISFQLDPKNKTEIEITDMKGNEMLKETMEKSSGMYTRQFDMKDYAKGEYLINISQGRKSVARHIIIE